MRCWLTPCVTFTFQAFQVSSQSRSPLERNSPRFHDCTIWFLLARKWYSTLGTRYAWSATAQKMEIHRDWRLLFLKYITHWKIIIFKISLFVKRGFHRMRQNCTFKQYKLIFWNRENKFEYCKIVFAAAHCRNSAHVSWLKIRGLNLYKLSWKVYR